MQIFEIVRVSRVMTGPGWEVHRSSGNVFKLLVLSRFYLNSFNTSAGNTMDYLVTLRVPMLGVLLPRPKHGFEDADLLRSICLARDQLPAFKCRHAVLHMHEVVFDYAFSHPDLVLLD